MSRLFGYGRVSTLEQTTDNQLLEIEQAGYKVEPKRMITEKISGAVPASERPEFQKLLIKLDEGDTLVVTKLDRLGRDSIDVQQTVKLFQEKGVRLIVLQLGNLDLTSTAGELITKVMAAFADFERDLIRERTLSGQARAWSQGKQKGRPSKLTPEQIDTIKFSPETLSQLASKYKVSRATVSAIKKAGKTQVPVTA